MRLILSESTEDKKEESPRELLETAIGEIIAICNNDQNFTESKKITDLDQELAIVSKKLQHQKKLFEKALELKKSIDGKVKDLDDEIFNMKVSILEKLGSEL